MTETREALTAEAQAAIDELSRLSLAEHTLESVMQVVADLCKRVIPGVDEVSVTVIERDKPTTVALTGKLALELDERQYEVGSGPCLDGAQAGTAVEIDDFATETRWPVYVARALECGVGGSLSVPVPLQREVVAALNLYATRPHAFDETSREVANAMAASAGIALANTHLYEAQATLAEQLRTAMRSRAVIEQAKGILMGARRCTAEEAFNILVSISQRSNRKLRDVAQALVDEAVRQSPPDGRPDDQL
ncbi:MAG: ANTAR domain-containing protein [Frankiaceae bacterium]